MSALKGVKILDLSRLYPGPFATMILGDFGAEVISIESPVYKNNPPHVYPVYRNKKHISLDLKKEKGKEIFFKLVKDADVLVEGFRPGVTKKLGVDYEKLNKINNKIIYCSITGFGQTGHMKKRPGHDINYISESGILDLIGKKDLPPVIPGIQIADAAGALYASNAILTALYESEKSGTGQYIDISITDSALSFATLLIHLSKLLNEDPKRGDMILAHRYPWYEVYETRDKRFISLGCLEPHFWQNLCISLNLEEYINFQFDDGKKEEIRKILSNIFISKTAIEWDEFFKDKDICFSIVKTLEEARNSLLFKDRDIFSEIDTEIGKMSIPGVVAKFDKTPGKINFNPPLFGENTIDVLLELGYSDTEINVFKDSGIIG